MRESKIQICLNSRVRNAIKKRSIQRKENVYIIVYNSIKIGRSVTTQSQMKQWCSVFIVIPVVNGRVQTHLSIYVCIHGGKVGNLCHTYSTSAMSCTDLSARWPQSRSPSSTMTGISLLKYLSIMFAGLTWLIRSMSCMPSHICKHANIFLYCLLVRYDVRIVRNLWEKKKLIKRTFPSICQCMTKLIFNSYIYGLHHEKQLWITFQFDTVIYIYILYVRGCVRKRWRERSAWKQNLPPMSLVSRFLGSAPRKCYVYNTTGTLTNICIFF